MIIESHTSSNEGNMTIFIIILDPVLFSDLDPFKQINSDPDGFRSSSTTLHGEGGGAEGIRFLGVYI
jgi:hypothetical protein